MSALRIYTAQVNPTVGDISDNSQLILSHYKKALEQHADICLLPEAVLCGYTPADLVLRPHFVADLKKAALEIAKEVKDTALVLSTPWLKDDGFVYNVALFIHQGEIQHIIEKQCLPNFSVMDEKRIFHAGVNDQIIPFKGVNIGLLVCHDTWWPEVAQTLKKKGADVLLSINGSPYALDKEFYRFEFCKERVIETSLPLVYVNLVGGQDEILFDGRSFTINPNEEEANLFKAWEDESKLLTLEKTPQGYRFKVGESAPHLPKWANMYQGLKLGFADYMKKCGFTKAVLGLSGGIDSALTATIATDVLGKENVTGILLPSKFTTGHANEDALNLAKNLGIQTHILPIEESVETLRKTLEKTGGLNNITEENLQARVRGTLLMGFANNTGALLLTTGNKSEVAVGFCTLYGDMNGGYNIIKDIYKTEVYALSRYRNSLSKVIPENSIIKEPSPELRHDQKDSDRLPPYDVLDDILQYAIEHKLGAEEIIAKGFDKKVVLEVLHLLKISEHKRFQGAPGVKIHGTAFGLDWRYPIANKYNF